MKLSTQTLRDSILRDYLETGNFPVGARLPTVKKLAARYRVSCPTVGKAIALLAAEGWLGKRRGSGIYVASLPDRTKASRFRRQRRIGCIVQSLRAILAQRVFEGVEQTARKHNCVVEVASSNWDAIEEKRLVDAMRQRGIQGIVLYPTTHRHREHEYLAREFRDYPIVVVDLYQPTMRRPHLIFDNWSAGREMTRHLLEQGRREIAFLKFSDDVPYRSVDDRVAGYRRALEDAGLPFVADRLIAFEGRGPLARDHREALERFLALNPRPTALITPYDPYARASIAWLRQRGVAAPEEVLVAGFDNLQDEPWEERFPTTQPDFVRMGERATELLLERMESRDFAPTGLILPCPLVSAGGEGVSKREEPTKRSNPI